MSKRKRCSSPDTLQDKNPEEDPFIPSTASESFLKILLEGQFCDVTFRVGPSNEEIRAHKVFLKARSAMLRTKFSDKWENEATVDLPQFEPKAFRSFLKFMYTDQVDLEDTDWMNVLEVAHFFLVKPLVSICAEIGLRDACSDISKAVEAFRTARLYDQTRMMNKIGDFMAKSFIELSQTEKFPEEVDDDTLCYLLQQDHLRVNECELFKIVLTVANARANIRRGESDDDEAVNLMVALEMEKFLPLLRIPTMTVNEFQTVVDPSGLLPTETVLNLYRYFTATDPAQKQAIASNWPHSTVQRRCRECVKLYVTSSPSPPEVRREISPAGLQLDDCISFYSTRTNLNLSAINAATRMSSCGSNGFGITGFGIKCPALFQGATEITEPAFDCRIKIQGSDLYSLRNYPGQTAAGIDVSCSVKPNDLTLVNIEPPVTLPSSGPGRGIRITAEVKLSPGKDKISGQKWILVQYPEGSLATGSLVTFCNHLVQLADLQNRPGRDYCTNSWQLITGVRIQAI